MSQGRSYESFAAQVDVCDDTLREWEKVHPEFSAAKKKAFVKALAWWENIGMLGMVNRKLNPALWIFTMKCRFRRFGYLPDSQGGNDDDPGFNFDMGDGDDQV